jgi:hypothetical protein
MVMSDDLGGRASRVRQEDIRRLYLVHTRVLQLYIIICCRVADSWGALFLQIQDHQNRILVSLAVLKCLPSSTNIKSVPMSLNSALGTFTEVWRTIRAEARFCGGAASRHQLLHRLTSCAWGSPSAGPRYRIMSVLRRYVALFGAFGLARPLWGLQSVNLSTESAMYRVQSSVNECKNAYRTMCDGFSCPKLRADCF